MIRPDADALEAHQRAGRLAAWKEWGPVRETALRAAERAERAFLQVRLDNWKRILTQKDKQ